MQEPLLRRACGYLRLLGTTVSTAHHELIAQRWLFTSQIAGPIIKYLKGNKCIILHKCTTIRHAKSAEKHGVDVLSVDGFECAGHPGEDDIGGLVLLARAVKELSVPFIASGGIADARGIAAALALGAAKGKVSQLVGLRADVPSSPIHQNIKDKIVASTERDTTHIFRTLHNTARVFKNKVAMEVVAIERRPGGAKFEDIRDLVSGARGRMVYENGDADYGIWSAGIAVGLINDIPTCEQLLNTLESELRRLLAATRTGSVEVEALMQSIILFYGSMHLQFST
ncbi:2-nitropropane dioxygenase [Salix suchowensis]|nr:2-nitropropane dioxygenase [Salix suchowensis]